ncbi:MAG: 16S rRNA (cytosine967-C5)-methyltransferase [Hyphomicrobiaceae bacterium]
MTDKKPQRFGRSAEPTLGAKRPVNKHSPKNPDRKPGHKPDSNARTADQKSPSKPAANRDGQSRSNGHRNKGGGNNGGGNRGGGKAKAGLLSRYLALTILESVLRDQTSLDTAIPEALADERFVDLAPRDKAFARLLAMTVLRHHASLLAVVGTYLAKPLAANAERIRIILMAGAAELILLKIAPHATISTTVELTRLSAKTLHFDKLANAILRRVSETGTKVFEETATAADNFPDWMIAGWREAYGPEVTDRIATACLQEAALDLTVKDSPLEWATRLEAIALPTGSLRRAAGGRIEDLEGYNEGGWWVQDTAASLPVQLLGAKPGSKMLDLCAAPGGKTAQLCAAGADVTAVDVSVTRMDRLRENLDRLEVDAITIAADAATWRSTELFDGVLIDAPCSSTGTIRRHPDIMHLKRPGDLERLGDIQLRLLKNAATLVEVGGTIVYCTCSLERVECEERIEQFLADPGAERLQFERVPIEATEVGGQADWITEAGDLRTFPFHLPAENPALAGIDGFYAARLKRLA